MSAADKIQAARALIEPLTGHTPGPWEFDVPEDESVEIGAGILSIAGLYEAAPDALPDARLIAAAPSLRDTVAALADLADAQAQEIAKLRAENERLSGKASDGERFDAADWFWRDMDPDDNGDSAHEAIVMMPEYCVCCVNSSFTGPTRFAFRAPVLDAESDDTEILHFATKDEALEAASKRMASRAALGETP